MTPRRIYRPVLYRRPTLKEYADMEQGRLAQWAFGKPTDAVFYVVEVLDKPAPRIPSDPA